MSCTPTRNKRRTGRAESDDEREIARAAAALAGSDDGGRPCTPPRKSSVQHPVSSLRTPIGGGGVEREDEGDDEAEEGDECFRTPKRRRLGGTTPKEFSSRDGATIVVDGLLSASSSSGHGPVPVTPKRSVGRASYAKSPFRTPERSSAHKHRSKPLSSSSSKPSSSSAMPDDLPSSSASRLAASSPFRTPGLTTPSRGFGPSSAFSSDFPSSIFSSGGAFSTNSLSMSGGFSSMFASSLSGYSPFRTPGRGGGYLDAQEQLAFFADELGGKGSDGSPGGLLGKDKGGFKLYESPGNGEMGLFGGKKYW